ncbi:unnamed protein product [Acanthosepion pharaonis]|uniref:Retropepsins domain-containing protein n=1 Tax=Acanthosepion pharaonis TaxID=158019 RepID=A0A812D5A4_ACAPH|nr:unnamed protein product [Sepia pharaonis]
MSPGTRCCRNPLPPRSVNAALPVVNVYVEGKRCSALVDTGCSRSIVSADRCVTWNSQQIEIRTIDGVSRACCGVGTVSVLTDGGSHAKVDVLVARQRPLGYDLLLGIDAIRALGGMMITPAGNVELDMTTSVETTALIASQPANSGKSHSLESDRILADVKRQLLDLNEQLRQAHRHDPTTINRNNQTGPSSNMKHSRTQRGTG